MSISCTECELLLSSFLENDPDLADEQRALISSHLQICVYCRTAFETDVEIAAFARTHWARIMERSQPERGALKGIYEDEAPEGEADSGVNALNIERSWKNLGSQLHIPSQAELRQQAWRRLLRYAIRYGVGLSAAACLVLTAWMSVQDGHKNASFSRAIHSEGMSATNETAYQRPPVTPLDGLAPFNSNELDAHRRASVARLETVAYLPWRTSHEEWFRQQFPWAFAAQTVLKDDYRIDVDYVDVLVASGDLWQFQYKTAGSGDQPYAVYEEELTLRLAEYFKIDAPEFTRKLGTYRIVAASQNHEKVETVGMRSAKAMEAWRDDLLSASARSDGISTDLQLSMLRAGTFFSNTRTASYLWFKSNPHEMDGKSDKMEFQVFLGLSKRESTPRELMDAIVGQIIASDEITRLGQAFLSMPPTHGCVIPAVEYRQRLEADVGSLVPTWNNSNPVGDKRLGLLTHKYPEFALYINRL